jgi:hypothetical protein
VVVDGVFRCLHRHVSLFFSFHSNFFLNNACVTYPTLERGAYTPSLFWECVCGVALGHPFVNERATTKVTFCYAFAELKKHSN